jgi:hypothetical protein
MATAIELSFSTCSLASTSAVVVDERPFFVVVDVEAEALDLRFLPSWPYVQFVSAARHCLHGCPPGHCQTKC